MKKVDELALMAYLDDELQPGQRRQVEAVLAQGGQEFEALCRLQEADALVEATLNEALTTPMPPIRAFQQPGGAMPRARASDLTSWWQRCWQVWRRPVAWAPVTAALAVGVIVGGGVGQDQGWDRAQQLYSEAGMLDPESMVLARKVLNQTLETELSGETAVWERPSSGVSGRVTPVRTYRTNSGIFCREFLEERRLVGERISLKGVACRTGEGWQLRSQTLKVL